MSMQQSPGGPLPPGQGTAGATDVVTQLQGIVRQLSAWVQAFTGRQTFGTFTMAASASTVVLQPAAQSDSRIVLIPTNASAAALMGSAKYVYPSAISPGVSFTVSTANSVVAAGTETFTYFIQTPV